MLFVAAGLFITFTFLLYEVGFPHWGTTFVIWYAKRKGSYQNAVLKSSKKAEGDPEAAEKELQKPHIVAKYKYKVGDKTYLYSMLFQKRPRKTVTVYYLPWRPRTAYIPGQKSCSAITVMFYAAVLTVICLGSIASMAYKANNGDIRLEKEAIVTTETPGTSEELGYYMREGGP